MEIDEQTDDLAAGEATAVGGGSLQENASSPSNLAENLTAPDARPVNAPIVPLICETASADSDTAMLEDQPNSSTSAPTSHAININNTSNVCPGTAQPANESASNPVIQPDTHQGVISSRLLPQNSIVQATGFDGATSPNVASTEYMEDVTANDNNTASSRVEPAFIAANCEVSSTDTVMAEGAASGANDIANLNNVQQPQSNGNLASAAQQQEPQQDDQQIEDAGIDPNYPLVLVRRVSLPSNDAGNDPNQPPVLGRRASLPSNYDDILNVDDASYEEMEDAVDEDNDADLDVAVDDSLDISLSESEDGEAAIMENPNLHLFRNQFLSIRNMIAQTRRDMAEAEANYAPSDLIPRNTAMQRFRRILFILNNRRRRLIRLGMTTPDEENSEGEANAEMEAADGDSSREHGDGSVDQDDEAMADAVRFDTNLPAEHSYMGKNMSRVSGVNYLDVDQCVKLRLFIHQHVLFPGEVLPFMVNSATTVIEGDMDGQNGILFGLCFPSLTYSSSSSYDEASEPMLHGVTCQIYELGEDGQGNTLIKSRALQRFVTKINDLSVPLEYINNHPRMKCFGYVKILPDIYLREPFKCMNMGSLNRFRDDPSMAVSFKRLQAATTPWPAHVYEPHNINNIIEKARTQLAQHKIDTMPADPTQLSYWLVRNLHLPESMLKSVFLANTVNTRLQLIASTFKEESIFACRSCGSHIANCRELFAMSKYGVQSQYCNSAGYIHETNTVYQVNRQNINYSGSPSTEFSWFPGYQWHIIVCKICKHHLGWEFKAVQGKLIPKQFFGISSSSVRVRAANDRADEVTRREETFYDIMRLIEE